MTKTAKLHFELYAYGDPCLYVDISNYQRYTIEQADKFELRYIEFVNDRDKTIHLGYYDTIYEVLDAANAHVAQQEDKYVMPEKCELEIFEDNQPDRPRRTNLKGELL